MDGLSDARWIKESCASIQKKCLNTEFTVFLCGLKRNVRYEFEDLHTGEKFFIR